jgi:hypothetical protein
MDWKPITIRSSDNSGDKIEFFWDSQAARNDQPEKSDSKKRLDLEWYLDWLEELKPSRKELYQTKLFNERFTLA